MYRIKQFRIHRVFAHHLDGIGRRKVAADRLPLLPKIGRSQDRRTIVTLTVTVGNDVRHISIEMRRLDA